MYRGNRSETTVTASHEVTAGFTQGNAGINQLDDIDPIQQLINKLLRNASCHGYGKAIRPCL
jgi:hypothetical protein